MSTREPINCDEEDARIAPRSSPPATQPGWFEQLYGAGESGRITMPWSRTEPDGLLVD